MKKQKTPWFLPILNFLTAGLFAFVFYYHLTSPSPSPLLLVLLAVSTISDLILGFVNWRKYKKERT